MDMGAKAHSLLEAAGEELWVDSDSEQTEGGWSSMITSPARPWTAHVQTSCTICGFEIKFCLMEATARLLCISQLNPIQIENMK